MARSLLDAAARGAFTSLNVTQAKSLIEKTVTNQGSNEEWLQPKKRGMHTVHEVDALSEKMDLLMKKLEEHANFKKDWEVIQHYASTRAIKAKQWCEVCGGNNSRNDCPETREVMSIINNNGNRPQNNGWSSRPNYQGNGGKSFTKLNSNNQPSLKDLVMSQTKINESMNNKLLANDKTLETLNAKMDDLASAVKNQLSFNKMLETQLAK